MSTRKNILSSIANTVALVSAIQTVTINKSDVVDLDTIPMPVAYIYSGSESVAEGDDAVIGCENWVWNIIIEVFAENTDMEDLLADIHKEMFKNYRLDENAVFSWRTGSDTYLIDPNRCLNMIHIEYYVLYRHTKGIP